MMICVIVYVVFVTLAGGILVVTILGMSNVVNVLIRMYVGYAHITYLGRVSVAINVSYYRGTYKSRNGNLLR